MKRRARSPPASVSPASSSSRFPDVNGILGRPSVVLAACVAGTGLFPAPRGRSLPSRNATSTLCPGPRTADISADGRSVAFESRARLVAADEDDRPDIYVLDRTTGLVTLESVIPCLTTAASSRFPASAATAASWC